MIQVCKFNPRSDVEKVVPSLSVDVAEVMATGVVASTADTTPYTKETEITEVGHYLSDKIQTAMAAYRLQKSMANAVSSPSSNSQPAPQAE